MKQFLTSFYYKEEGLTSAQLGIFECINRDDAVVNHLRFFCRKPEEGELVKLGLHVYELTEDTAHIVLAEQIGGILDNDFLELLAKKIGKVNFGFEYYIED